jgi:hypothetical protein
MYLAFACAHVQERYDDIVADYHKALSLYGDVEITVFARVMDEACARKSSGQACGARGHATWQALCWGLGVMPG